METKVLQTVSRRSGCFLGCPDPADPALLKHLLFTSPWTVLPQGTVPNCSLCYSTAWSSPALQRTRSAAAGKTALQVLLHSKRTDPAQHQCLLFHTQVSLGKQSQPLQGKFRFVSLLFPSVISSGWADPAQAEGGKGRHPCQQMQCFTLRHHWLCWDEVRMGSKTMFLSTVNMVCSTKGFCKSFQGPWTFELLPQSSVRLLLLFPWPGNVDFALVVTGLERNQSKTPPYPQLFVIHYLLLSCSWQTSLSYGSYCLVSELGPVSCDCLLPVLLVSFFIFSGNLRP